MKFNKIMLFAAVGLVLASCYKDGTDFMDESTSISLYPAPAVFGADGLTVDGDENYVGAVTVRVGTSVSDMGWTAEGPSGCEWGTLRESRLITQYPDVLGTRTVDVESPGFEITMQPNKGYKRIYRVLVSAQDGTQKFFDFVQLGEKADAEITCETEKIEIPCIGGETDDIVYTTNMGNVYEYEIAYEGDQKDWLKVKDKGPGKFSLSADPWSDEQNDRKASLTITIGSESTSIATLTLPVTQMKFDTYYYVYGASTGLDRAASVAMTKASKGVYSVKQFAFDAGTNVICFNKDTRSEAYPVYYLKADGTVGESSSAVTATDLAIKANGVYNITVNFNDKTYRMDPVNKCGTAMPDSELSKYPTKDYVTANGGKKTWMTVSLHWNGGASVGSMKLGSGLVGGEKTGGYGTPTDKTVPYDSRNSAYDTQENGGAIEELLDASGNPLSESFGRLYAASEFYTGSPSGCLNDRYQMDCPFGNPGDIYTDDAGATYTLENIIISGLSIYDANAAGDAQAEKEHPCLKAQIQGICPFGWHVANMQDWKDLVYAASVVSAGTDKPVSADQANYKSLAGGSITNFASVLYAKEWFEWTKTSKSGNRNAAAADSFGWNMFVQGWRLFATGYDYAYNTSNPRFYASIPLMGQYTDKKRAFWRMFVTGEGTNMSCNDGCDIGNGCGTAFRCVKNYKN